eukprot:15456698-Alexandrium_andersonii.AAC.1
MQLRGLRSWGPGCVRPRQRRCAGCASSAGSCAPPAHCIDTGSRCLGPGLLARAPPVRTVRRALPRQQPRASFQNSPSLPA